MYNSKTSHNNVHYKASLSSTQLILVLFIKNIINKAVLAVFMVKKYFTVDTAQKQIPKIKKSLLKLQHLKKAIDAITSVRIDPKEIDYDELVETNTKLSKEFHKLSYEFYIEIENLEKTGCVLKDLEQGLADFYCRFESRDIFLCWKLGEEKIKAWHEVDDGFIGRKKIIELE